MIEKKQLHFQCRKGNKDATIVDYQDLARINLVIHIHKKLIWDSATKHLSKGKRNTKVLNK